MVMQTLQNNILSGRLLPALDCRHGEVGDMANESVKASIYKFFSAC